MKNNKLLLLAVLAIVLVMSGCVSNPQGSPKGTPMFTAMKSNNTTVTVMLIDAYGKNVTGLHVDSPAIGSPDVIASGENVPVGKQIKITDPALAGKVNITVSTTIDGNKTVVINGHF